MITHVLIKDYALIENIDIDLFPGFNVITGETGAGKSIIVGAISLALGSRADTAMVRAGREKALVQLVVDETSIPEEDQTGIELISREISSSGKSISRINGEIVTLAELCARTNKIADLHGQYDHQNLLDSANHIEIVDSFQADYIFPERDKVKEYYAEYKKAKKDLDLLLETEASSKRELDFLRYEINEIENVSLVPNEYEELKDSLAIMQNSEKIYESLNIAYEALSAENAALDAVGKAKSQLQNISSYTEEYSRMERVLSESYFELTELENDIRSSLNQIDFSQQSLNDVISRIDTIDRLISKYGNDSGRLNDENMTPTENVIAYCENAKTKLSNIERFDERKAELEATLNKREQALHDGCEVLSKLRKKAAEKLEELITQQLIELNFTDAIFKVSFAEDTDFSSPKEYTESGFDSIEFLLTANKGQPLRPLVKVASGGEMSRIMLAIKTVLGDFDKIPTMIFDEIDTGISGVTASVVGEKIANMSESHQIVCITHLPQIAAYADHHFVINKSSDDDNTYTTIAEISGEDKIEGIARLLGGKNITETTLKSARELVELSKQ